MGEPVSSSQIFSHIVHVWMGVGEKLVTTRGRITESSYSNNSVCFKKVLDSKHWPGVGNLSGRATIQSRGKNTSETPPKKVVCYHTIIKMIRYESILHFLQFTCNLKCQLQVNSLKWFIRINKFYLRFLEFAKDCIIIYCLN